MQGLQPMMLEALALAAPGEVVFVEPQRFEAARVQLVDPDDVSRSGIGALSVTRVDAAIGDAASAELIRVRAFDADTAELGIRWPRSLAQLRAEREVAREEERAEVGA